MFKKIILVLAMSLLLVVPAFANEAPKTVVQVSGNSQKEVTPDVARINISMTSVNANLEKAKNENTQIVNRVFASLNDQGITNEQIKTNTYQVDPIYNYEKDRLPKLEGYRVTNGLEIRTSIDKVGILVNEVTNAGANEINSIRFETANETESKNEALKDAIADALKKAEIIAATLNKRVARVTLVNESGVSYHPVMMESRLFKAASMDGGVPNIQAGKVTVGANVQVTVELE
ncbi:SIMPL domain-containing protein [Pelosinus sp. sgz500959]|uniref:SIMPL domain-containing protein n=1 Tax=Pelosinus sp. sgz500959 TaxID=3242472 RepID=UPI00366BA013